MTELITLNLTLKELQQIDKYVEINDDTLSVIMKITNAYPQQKSSAEKAYKEIYGWYPPTTPSVSNYEDNRWSDFQNGYNASQKDYKVGEYEPTSQETQMTLEKSGEFSIVSYNGETYYRNLYDGICGGWYKTDTDGEVFYLVEDETERKLEKLYQEQVVVEQEPEENEWKTVALRFGEKLSAIGPCGYYDFSPGEWVEWALNAYEKTADDYLRLLKKEPKKEQKWDVVRESVKWHREHPDESVEDWVKPHTPKPMNEVLDRLENKYENDDVVNRMLKKWEENPPDFLKFELSKSLEDRIYKWWETCFVHHPEWSMEECVEDLLDIITSFLPGEQDSSGSQNIDTVVAVEGFNDCLKKIKSKLRNKK